MHNSSLAQYNKLMERSSEKKSDPVIVTNSVAIVGNRNTWRISQEDSSQKLE